MISPGNPKNMISVKPTANKLGLTHNVLVHMLIVKMTSAPNKTTLLKTEKKAACVGASLTSADINKFGSR